LVKRYGLANGQVSVCAQTSQRVEGDASEEEHNDASDEVDRTIVIEVFEEVFHGECEPFSVGVALWARWLVDVWEGRGRNGIACVVTSEAAAIHIDRMRARAIVTVQHPSVVAVVIPAHGAWIGVDGVVVCVRAGHSILISIG
jgi:hypothetical protein